MILLLWTRQSSSILAVLATTLPPLMEIYLTIYQFWNHRTITNGRFRKENHIGVLLRNYVLGEDNEKWSTS